MINSSLEWPDKESILINKTMTLLNGFQIRRMIRNVRPKIKELAANEVEIRFNRNNKVDELLIEINDHIQLIEEYIFIATLTG